MTTMDLLQSVLRDMGIDLGGGDVGMAQHHLNGADIRTPIQEVGGEGMAQSVRGNLFADSCFESIPPNHLPKRLSREGTARKPHEEIGAQPSSGEPGAGGFQIPLEMGDSRGSQGYDSLLGSFSRAAHIAHREVDGVEEKAYQFGNPHSRGIKDLEHRLIPDLSGDLPGGGRKEPFHLLHR